MTVEEIVAEAVSESARYNKRHQCIRPEIPAAMCTQIAHDAIIALAQAGYAVVPRTWREGANPDLSFAGASAGQTYYKNFD